MKKKSSQFNEFLQNIHPGASKYLLPAGIAAAAGGLGAGVLTSRGDERPEEDNEERRSRILRNAMLGAGSAGAAAGLGSFGYNQLSTPLEKGDPGAVTSMTRDPALIGTLGAAGYAGLGAFVPGLDVVDGARREALAAAKIRPDDWSRGSVRNMFSAKKVNPERLINAIKTEGGLSAAQQGDLLRRTGLGGYSNAKVLPSWAKSLGMTEGVKVPHFLQRMKALRLGGGPARTRLGLAAAIGLAPALASTIF